MSNVTQIGLLAGRPGPSLESKAPPCRDATDQDVQFCFTVKGQIQVDDKFSGEWFIETNL